MRHSTKKVPDSSGDEYKLEDNTNATIAIPNVIKKELTQDFDGKTAHYTITVNESKISLSGHLPILIHDTMSEYLAYIGGSLVIKTVDKDGHVETLTRDVDYKVVYDGSGGQQEDGVAVHVLDIEIMDMKPVEYILDYDTTLIIPENPEEGITYGNSASISLGGKSVSASSEKKTYYDMNISAVNYKVTLTKTDAATGALLPGAVFGMYNEQGGLITSGTTDEKGNLVFETNVTKGIILLSQTPYYLQEITAPPGYVLDDTKHWFLFCDCDEKQGGCDCPTHIDGIKKIPEDEIGVFNLTNQYAYELPSTGSAGGHEQAKHLLLYGLLILVICTGLLCRKRYKGRRIEGE